MVTRLLTPTIETYFIFVVQYSNFLIISHIYREAIPRSRIIFFVVQYSNFLIIFPHTEKPYYIFVVFLIIFPRIFVLYFLWSNILIF